MNTTRYFAAALLTALVVMVSGCGRAEQPVVAEPITGARSLEAPGVAGAPVGAETPIEDAVEPRPLAADTLRDPVPSLGSQIVSLPTVMPGLPEAAIETVPVRLRIPSIGVDAQIVAVGVDENGDFDVPPADQVGWYRFGAVPGEQGSAVLAAHIAYDGSDGVFRSLDDVEPGAPILVEFDDGSMIDLVTTAQNQYGKEELPDDLFARAGDPRVVLITCGGDFNRSRSSYEDNVVAFATPVT